MTERRQPTAGQTPLLTDEGLMRRVQDGDVDAFEELYHRHSARAFGLARVLCVSGERAEEAVQDGFLALWRTRARYDQTRGGVRTWILALIRNRSIDIHRRNRRGDGLRASEGHLDVVAAPGCVEDDAVRQDEGDQLRASLQLLPDLQREVIVLAYYGGLTQTEIAEHLALPLGTVKGRMRLGLRKVRTESAHMS